MVKDDIYALMMMVPLKLTGDLQRNTGINLDLEDRIDVFSEDLSNLARISPVRVDQVKSFIERYSFEYGTSFPLLMGMNQRQAEYAMTFIKENRNECKESYH